jgi:hypothetical protein
MRAEPLRRPGDGFVGRAARYDRRRRMTDARGPKPMSPSERALKRIEAKVSRLFENANQRIDKVEASVDLGNKAIADQLNSMFLEQRQILGETRDSFKLELQGVANRIDQLERRNLVEDEVADKLATERREAAAQRGAHIALDERKKRPSWTLATFIALCGVAVATAANLPAILKNIGVLIWHGIAGTLPK